MFLPKVGAYRMHNTAGRLVLWAKVRIAVGRSVGQSVVMRFSHETALIFQRIVFRAARTAGYVFLVRAYRFRMRGVPSVFG